VETLTLQTVLIPGAGPTPPALGVGGNVTFRFRIPLELFRPRERPTVEVVGGGGAWVVLWVERWKVVWHDSAPSLEPIASEASIGRRTSRVRLPRFSGPFGHQNHARSEGGALELQMRKQGGIFHFERLLEAIQRDARQSKRRLPC
jgi:hypothetical protein